MPHQFARAIRARRFALARAEALAFVSMPVLPGLSEETALGTRHRMRERLTRA